MIPSPLCCSIALPFTWVGECAQVYITAGEAAKKKQTKPGTHEDKQKSSPGALRKEDEKDKRNVAFIIKYGFATSRAK